MYFVDGAETWIKSLIDHMQTTHGVKILNNWPVALSCVDGTWTLTNTATKERGQRR